MFAFHFSNGLKMKKRRRRGAATAGLVVSAGAALAVIGAGAYFVLRPSGPEGEPPVLKLVTRGSFESIVLDQGEVESSENVEFRCKLKGQSEIKWIIEEGTMVKGGDVLVEFDASLLETELQNQQVMVNNKESIVINSEGLYEAAVVSKEEYLEGTFKQEEQTIQNEIFEAEENLRKAQQYLAYSEKLAARNFVTPLQLEADRFAVQKAQNALSLANRKLDVLRNQTQKKMLIGLDADIKSFKKTWENDQKIHQVEIDKLTELEEQLNNCKIVVPEGMTGQVVHANRFSSRGGNAEWVAEQGAKVYETQVVVRLPNPDKMQVKAKVSESRVTSVTPGMPVSIQLDALAKDEILMGEVVKVNQYPEPEGWSGGGVKQYGVIVMILDPPPAIRAGMNASVNILIEQRDNAIQIPLQAVYEYQGHTFCLIKAGDGWETRKIKVAANNDEVAVIDDEASGFDSLAEGEEVVMNPRKHADTLMELPDLPDVPTVATDKKGYQGTGEKPAADEKPKAPADPIDEQVGQIFGMMDTNGDGKIGADEIAAMPEDRQKGIKEADSNGDGEVTLKEMAPRLKKMMQGRGGGGGGRGAGGGGRP